MDGVVQINHDDKFEAMSSHYTTILGIANSTRWNFDVAALYSGAQAEGLSDLVAPFYESEALHAIKANNINSAPGADGFGPSCYAATWPAVKDDVLGFLSSFHI